MRKVCSQPLALGMSLVLLVALAVCGVITKAAQPTGSNQNPWRAICAPQHPICAPVIAGIGGTLLLLASRDTIDQALFAETATEADPAPAEATDAAAGATSASTVRTLIAGLACLWWALLSVCVAPRGITIRRAALPLPLRQITEHRVAPAP